MRLLVREDMGEHHCIWCKLDITSERQLEHKSSSSSILVMPASSRHKTTSGSAGISLNKFHLWQGKAIWALLGADAGMRIKGSVPWSDLNLSCFFQTPHSWQPLSATLLFEMGPRAEYAVLNLISTLVSLLPFCMLFLFEGQPEALEFCPGRLFPSGYVYSS